MRAVRVALLLLAELTTPSLLLAGGTTNCEDEPFGTFLDYGETVVCEINPVGDSEVIRFLGLPGELIRIQISDGDGTTPFPIIVAELSDPLGLSGGTTTSTLTASLIIPGLYTILVHESGDNQTTPFTLSLHRILPPLSSTPRIQIGTETTGSIDPFGDLDLFHFSGTGIQKIYAQVADGNGLSPFPIATLELVGPTGLTLWETDSGGSFSLPQGGTYSLFVSENGRDHVSGYTLALESLVPISPTASPICYGCLALEQIVPMGELDLYYVEGTAGQTIYVQITDGDGQNPFPITTVTLFDPSGSPLVESTASFSRTLSVSGEYSLLVNELGRDQTPNYALAVESLAPPSPSAIPLCYGCLEQEAIEPVGDVDLFAFDGLAGDVVRAQVSDGDGTEPFPVATLELYNPSGTLVAATTSSAMVTLGSTGTYTLLISERSADQTTDYAVAIQCIAGPCSLGNSIFGDGFEAGDASAWSDIVSD